MAIANLAVKVSAQITEFQKDFSTANKTIDTFGKEIDGIATQTAKLGSAFTIAEEGTKGFVTAVKQFSGTDVITKANTYAAAVEKIGGATNLTAKEQKKVNDILSEAIAKYAALGQTAPEAVLKLAAATSQVPPKLTLMQQAANAATGSLGQMFSAFSLANIATGLVGKLAGAVGEFIDRGQRLPAIQQGFERLVGSIGQDSRAMIATLQTATKGMVGELELMQATNKAVLLGLPITTESMGDLAKAATTLGRAMGLDATQSVDDFITALGRSSPQILDNLGLTVKVGEANEAYAKTLGKTAGELTDAEKKMAFYNAAMEAARKKTLELGDQTKTLGEIMTTVWVKIRDGATQAAGDFNVGIGRMISSWEKFKQAIEGSRGQTGAGTLPVAAILSAVRQEQADAIAQSMDALVRKGKEWSAVGKKFNSDLGITVQTLDELKAEEDEVTESIRKHAKAVADADREERKRLEGMRDFVDWARKMDKAYRDLAITMSQLIHDKLLERGERQRKILEDSTESTLDWLKTIKTSSTVVAGLGDSLAKVGTQVAITIIPLKSRFEDMRDASTAWGNALQRLGSVVSGTFGNLLQSASTALRMFADLSDSADKFLRIIKPTFTQTATFAIQAAASVVGYAQIAIGVIRGLMDSLTGAEARAAFDMRGGLQQFRTDAALAGSAFTDLSDDASNFRNEIARLDRVVADNARRMETYGVSWLDFRDDLQQIQIDQFARTLITDFRALERQIGNTPGTLRAMSGALSQLVVDAVRTGQKIPIALKPILDQLIRMGGLTDAAARAMLGLAEDTMPSLADITDAAARYGLTLDQLGSKVKQLRITQTATEIVNDFNLLIRAGADVGVVMVAMKDKVQGLVTDALKLGLELPSSLRPLIQSMIDAGLLTDEFGDKLTDTSRLQFATPLAERFDILIGKLDDLIDAFSQVGTAAEEGFGRARGAAEALGRAIPRGSAPSGSPGGDDGGTAAPRSGSGGVLAPVDLGAADIQPAAALTGSGLTLVSPRRAAPATAGAAVAITVNTWDGKDTERVMRERIIPDLKRAILQDTVGLRTTIEDVAS